MANKIIERNGVQIEIRPDNLFRRIGAHTSNWQMQADGMTLDETIDAWIATWLATDNSTSNSIRGSFRIN
jgi:hypothetical protein